MGEISQPGVAPATPCAECPQPGKRSALPLWGLTTITQRSLSIPPACSGRLQLDASRIYSRFKACLTPEVGTAGPWEGTHCLFSGRHLDMRVLPKKDLRGSWAIKTARQATRAGVCRDRQAHSPGAATKPNKTS